MKYIIVGDRNAYLMEALNINDAWFYAEMELKYQYTGNTKIQTVLER